MELVPPTKEFLVLNGKQSSKVVTTAQRGKCFARRKPWDGQVGPQWTSGNQLGSKVLPGGERHFFTGLLSWKQDAWGCRRQAGHHTESASEPPVTYGKGL